MSNIRCDRNFRRYCRNQTCPKLCLCSQQLVLKFDASITLHHICVKGDLIGSAKQDMLVFIWILLDRNRSASLCTTNISIVLMLYMLQVGIFPLPVSLLTGYANTCTHFFICLFICERVRMHMSTKSTGRKGMLELKVYRTPIVNLPR